MSLLLYLGELLWVQRYFKGETHKTIGYACVWFYDSPLPCIAGSKVTLLGKAGVTQGDPLAMLVYCIGILPLTRKLKDPEKWKQNWYADDSACLAKLLLLKEWLAALMEEGPKFGYYPEPDEKLFGCAS